MDTPRSLPTWPSRWFLPTMEVDELDEKVKEYLQSGGEAGLGRPFCLPRLLRSSAVDGTVSWLEVEDELTGEDVIPGFRCRVGDFFPKEAEAAANPEPAPEAGHP